MLFYLILWIIGFIASLLFFLYISGAFYKIHLEEKKLWPFKVAYKKHIGDYKKINFIINKINKKLLEENIKTSKWIWIYYDNPGKIPISKLKSDWWCIIEKNDYKKIKWLWKDYNIKDIKGNLYIISEFPYKNNLSIMIGIIKIYPALWRYCKEKWYKIGPTMEIYDKINKKITYAMEILKN